MRFFAAFWNALWGLVGRLPAWTMTAIAALFVLYAVWSIISGEVTSDDITHARQVLEVLRLSRYEF